MLGRLGCCAEVCKSNGNEMQEGQSVSEVWNEVGCILCL